MNKSVGIILAVTFLFFGISTQALAQKRIVKASPNEPGGAPFDIYVGREFQIYDYHKKLYSPVITIYRSEGYRTGAVERGIKDLSGLFDKYLPLGDSTLTYHEAKFDSKTLKVTIKLTKCVKIPVIGNRCGSGTA